MLATDNWTNNLYTKCAKSGNHHCVIDVQFKIAKWVFVGCIIFSFLLLGYEWYKARKVLRSRDISYTFCNTMANDYVSIKSYDSFCLFCRISANKKKKDKIAFFVFFSFKDWKRTILADGPRQSINAIVLFMIAKAYDFRTDDIPKYWDGQPWTALLLISMILTVLIFLVSLGFLIAAAVLYVPLLCYIQGNLKEYVCHKVDKRIGEIIRKSQKRRIARNAELEKKIDMGLRIKNANGEFIDASLLKPTLPNISLDDDKPLVRSASPAFGRSASPAFGRTASPAFGRPPPPANYASPYRDVHKRASPDYPDNDPYDDIFDEYADKGHSYPPRPQDDDFASSSTSLVAHAAPPGRAFAPAMQPSRPSTPIAGAPDFPPAAAPGYPPPVQFEATRQPYGFAPPDPYTRRW
ncbi:hypothetical protein CC85DRAFT_148814 [Cutaneotrichosporon oleaginosum]|uniref:Vacuole protein n=1 Tax=Cutaneotrichosporon oleaginosum TaxID=879819 RepID=A0A0J0XHF1_9TREE|nr:uncharacterized protein CC85DRAFT_148814 [Cutaneotrichosporon oleaginosum]KLT40555.1 hypothetical protein CC85DRAFT_148814 [Cutaneotrichosporon oleaginosum]TXT08374.1 hypothetical protein COLE_05298 [Cutaneotrichosporon oleaginosum]